MADSDTQPVDQLRTCTRREFRRDEDGGSYSIREVEGYDVGKLHARLNQLLQECDVIAEEEGVEVDAAVEEVCRAFTDLITFPVPSIYLDGDRKWCFDWDEREDGRGVYTRLETENKLLVIVDEHQNVPAYP